MIYDLHTHSNASDGFLSPTQLVLRAAAMGVTHLALTDHDTLEGLAEARQQATLSDLTLINGIELSCLWMKRGIHIVGLNVNPDSEPLREAISIQIKSRELRAQEIADRLAKIGIAHAYEGAKKIANGAVIGRPHFARFLVEKGISPNVNSAFKHYLGAGKVGDVGYLWPDIASMVSAIKDASGVAVLAHPLRYDLTLTKLRTLITEFAQSGGMAIEVVSGRQTPSDTQTLAQLAADFQLYASCGSDFHMPDQAWQELGRYSPLPEHITPVWQCWH